MVYYSEGFIKPKNFRVILSNACGGPLFFFASPKKNQKRSPEIDNSPISGTAL